MWYRATNQHARPTNVLATKRLAMDVDHPLFIRSQTGTAIRVPPRSGCHVRRHQGKMMLSLRVGQSRQAASAHGGAIRTIATGIAVGLAVSMSGCSAAGSATSGMSGKTVKMFTWVGNASDHDQWAAYINGGKLVDPSLSVDFSGPAIGSYYTKLPTQLQGTAAPCLI